jgi:hypothetical protein
MGGERKLDCLRLTSFPSRLIVFAQVATRVEGKLVRKVQTPRATLVARRATTGGRCRTIGGEIALLGQIRNRDILTSQPGAITLLWCGVRLETSAWGSCASGGAAVERSRVSSPWGLFSRL